MVRDTIERVGEVWAVPVAANAKIDQGELVVIDAGYAKPGATAENLIALGRAEESKDNTGGANGAVYIVVRRGVFAYDNASAGNAVTAAELGKTIYINDASTVTKTATGRSAAGVCRGFTDDGQVWVEIR